MLKNVRFGIYLKHAFKIMILYNNTYKIILKLNHRYSFEPLNLHGGDLEEEVQLSYQSIISVFMTSFINPK